MRRFFLSILPLLAATLAVVLMISFGASTLHAQETPSPEEPNNTFGKAYPLDLGVAVDAAISPEGDVDWYSVEVGSPGELALTIGAASPELTLWARVWNGERVPISGWFTVSEAGEEIFGFVDLVAEGEYYIEVVADEGDLPSESLYVVSVDFTPVADIGEPNDRFGDATWIGDEQLLRANILPAGDADWYWLDVADAGELSIEIGDVPADLAVSVRVWNADREAITSWFAPLAVGGETSAVADLPGAGVYSIEVTAESGQRSAEPYTLEWAFTPTGDLHEPNDRFALAAPLEFGDSYAATTFPQRDLDIYVIKTPSQGELSVEITQVPEVLNVEVRLRDNNLDVLNNWVGPLAHGGDTSATFDLPAGGRYFLEIGDGSADARSVDPYLVAVEFVPTGDESEPNDLLSRAVALPFGEEVHATIFPQRDRDWFAIDLPYLGELVVSATEVPADLDVSMRVWNSNRDPVSDWFAPLAHGGDTTLTFDAPEPGRYYLEVADGGDDARSVEPFLLSATFTAVADTAEPNNALEEASWLELDTTLAANILPAHDVDWYELYLDAPATLHLLATHIPSDMAIALRLWDADGAVLTEWRRPLARGGDTSFAFEVEEEGNYYLEVADDAGGRSTQPYWLIASLEEIDPAAIPEPALAPETESTDTGSVDTGSVDTEDEADEGGSTVAGVGVGGVGSQPGDDSDSGDEAEDAETDQGASEEALSKEEAPEEEAVDLSTVTLDLPEGWVREEGDEIVVRLDGEDSPGAPAVRIAPASAMEYDLGVLLEEENGALEILEEPQTVTIGNASAVVIGVGEDEDGVAVIRRYVLVTDPSGEVWLVVLEADSESWAEFLPDLEAILESLDFVAP